MPRKSGIDIIGDVPWGTHFCQFYDTRQDLADLLVPYFKAGLENNEFCLWVTAEPLGQEDSARALRQAVPDLDRYLAKGQIEIIPYTGWYLKGGAFEEKRVLDGWIEKLNGALGRGFGGLRLAGNTFFLEKRVWRSFAEYEATVNAVIGNYNMIAICTYPLAKCGASEVIDVVRNHQFALVRREGKWEFIEGAHYKQSREALQRSTSRLERSQALAHLGSWELDVVNNVLTWSDEVHRIFGLQPGEFGATYEAFLEAVHPDDRAAVDEAYSGSLREGKDGYQIEHRVVRKHTGETRYVHERCEHVKDEAGKIVRSLGMVHDITERKRAEAALRASQEELATVLANVPIMTLLVDADRRVIEVNSAASALAGRSPEEMVGLRGGEALGCLHSLDDPRGCGFGAHCQACMVRLCVIETFETGRSHRQVEWHLPIQRNGTVEELTFLLSTVLLSTPRKQVLLCIDDITERKRAEEARERLLRQVDEERAKMAGIVQQMPAGVFIAEAPSGNIVLINEEMERIWGRVFPAYRSFDEYAHDNRIFHMDGRPFTAGERPLARAIRGETVVDEEVEFERGDGSHGTALVSATPVVGADGKVIFGVATLRDITGQKRAGEVIKNLNEDLRRHAAELEASNRELESFAYSVSHDLRAPLRTLDGFSQALLEDYAAELDGQARDYLRRIQDSSRLLGQLIDDLLSLSRVTRADMHTDMVNLSEMTQGILSELQNAEPERRAKLIIAPGLITEGDSRLLRLALENLLGNAWKFTGRTSLARIEFGSLEHDGRTAYFVRDNGAGFDMAYAGKLFAPFQRLHSAGDFPGVGIGLATVQRVINRHGGRVWAEGEVDRGATFYFTLG